MAKKVKAKKKSRRMSRSEKFAREQMERYIEIHKENEKDLRYIG
ncbi:MAG TPA: hypothetical protein VJJ76_00345 [archaeon]|nr:hypothetical protein [archaeon]